MRLLRLLKIAMSSPGHEIQSFFPPYLVPHFSEGVEAVVNSLTK